MDTKQCPYCGEEVLAVAKKCKHCGEWLEKDTTSTPKKMVECPVCAEQIEEGLKVCPHCKEPFGNTQKNKLTEKVSLNNKPPNYGLLSQMAWYTIIVEVLCIIKAFIGDDVYFLSEKASLLALLLALPSWVLTICSGFLMVYLLIGLRKHYMTKRADKPIPFLALICLMAGMWFCFFIANIAADADFFVLEWMVFIPVIVFEFIVGVQLTAKLKEASSVGIAMIVSAAVGIFASFIALAFSFNDEATPWVTVIDSGIAICFFIVLEKFFNKEKANVEIENTNDEDSKNTVID